MNYFFKNNVWLLMLAAPALLLANYPKANVSFADHRQLVEAVEAHRAERLIDFDTFLQMSREPGTIILDARSTFRFNRVHLAGARHLSFTDFTQANLAGVIPSFETRILIYCNNNFAGNPVDFASKIATPGNQGGGRIASQLHAQAKPMMMALNIPTYLNLYGYGYRNVYELDELLDINDPRVQFSGSLAGPLRPLSPLDVPR